MGASLLAKRPSHPTSMLTDTPHSRAGSLPQRSPAAEISVKGTRKVPFAYPPAANLLCPVSLNTLSLITCVYRLQPVCLARNFMDACYDSYRITLHRYPRPRAALRPRGRALPRQSADPVGGREKA
ncbi:hypothetical protein EAH72_07340 [Pseudomonas caspiana]|nr:hypothetical protein EAH72_07340 [Pseudomonas caspiana]